MNVSIVGATGYSGLELIRLLQHHPYAKLSSIISGSQSGEQLTHIYPHLAGIISSDLDRLEDFQVERLTEEADLVFLATPSGVSSQLLPQLIEANIKCIDLSGDFRLKSPALYEQWYHKSAADPHYLEQVIYGLSEIYADQIKQASFIANPGCYPTAALLALVPVVQHGWIEDGSIIIDGKTGVSGAGRGLSMNTHFSETNENVKAYKLGVHQHTPEIEQVLADVSGESARITFSTHLLPMTRGIMCTVYVQLKAPKSTQDVIRFYRDFYQDDPFVRIRPEGNWPSTKEVYGSNYCDLGFLSDPRTGRLTIVSVIDNVVKGASGQAIQNMNMLHGWDVTAGLAVTPVYP